MLFNADFSSFAQGEWEKALSMMEEMRAAGIKVSGMAYSAAIKVRAYIILLEGSAASVALRPRGFFPRVALTFPIPVGG